LIKWFLERIGLQGVGTNDLLNIPRSRKDVKGELLERPSSNCFLSSFSIIIYHIISPFKSHSFQNIFILLFKILLFFYSNDDSLGKGGGRRRRIGRRRLINLKRS